MDPRCEGSGKPAASHRVCGPLGHGRGSCSVCGEDFALGRLTGLVYPHKPRPLKRTVRGRLTLIQGEG